MDFRATYLAQDIPGTFALSAPIYQSKPPRRTGDRNIIGDRKIRQQRKLLKNASDPMPGSIGGGSEVNQRLVQVHPALIGPDYPGDNLHQRTFAGTIFADYGVNGAERAREINISQGRDATVPLGNPFEPEEGMTYRFRHQLMEWLDLAFPDITGINHSS
jgi:hypothetical protein